MLSVIEKPVLFAYHGSKTSSGTPTERNHWAVQKCTIGMQACLVSCSVLGNVILLAGKDAPQLPVFCFWDCSSLGRIPVVLTSVEMNKLKNWSSWHADTSVFVKSYYPSPETPL